MSTRRLIKRVVLVATVVFATMGVADVLRAQDVVKANNTTTLVDGASWVGGSAPTSSNVALWNNTVTAANTPDLGGNLSIAGIKITNPGGAIGISSGTVNSGAVTANSTADTFTYTGTDVVNGNIVSFGGTTPAGITNGRLYFIVNTDTAAKTYQVSETANGSAINFTSSGSAVTNTARYAITIGSSGIDLSSATRSLSTLTAPVSLSADQTWTTTTFVSIDSNNSTNASGVSILNNGHALTIDTSGGTIDLGNIYGGGGITKSGTGFLNLYGAASNYTGDFVINAGTVNAWNDAGALGAGALTMNGGTLTAQASSARSFNRNTTIAGNAGFYNNNSGRTGSMPYTFGTLSIGAFTFSVTANGSGTGSLTFGATTLTGNPTFDVGSRDSNFLILGAVGESGGPRGFTKSGVGTLTITGASTYTGTTTIAGGSLKIDTNGSFANSVGIVVGNAGSSGASLDLTAKSGTFTFGAGQTVNGIGTINIGAGKTVAVAGVWAPGNSIGSNAVTGNLALFGTSEFELGTPGGSTSSPGTADFTAVSGTLGLGGVLRLLDNANANTLGSYGAGSYRLFTYGAVSGSFAGVTVASVTTRGAIVDGGSGTSTGQGIFVNVYNLAAGSIASGTSVNLGVIHAGASFVPQMLSITNTAAAGSFSEGLNASVSGSTGNATSGGTAITNLAASGTASTITVSLGDTTPGAKTGSITIGFQSNGSTTSGLPTISAGSQTVSLTGSVFSGSATWNTNGGGSWGSAEGGPNWTSTGGVAAAPGTFTGYTNTDSATFGAALASGTGTILLDGAAPSLSSIVFSNTTGRYVIDKGSSGSLTLATVSGKPTVEVVTGGLHEIKAGILGSSGLQKTGGGTLMLSGSSSYSGDTAVSAGTLTVNGSLTNASLTVASGATLMGSGVIAGTTTILGMHKPGNSPGIQTFSNLTYSGSTASVTWELWDNTTSNSPLAYDQINVGGDLSFTDLTTLYLSFTGTGSSVNWADAFWNESRSWVMYDVGGTTAGFGNLALVVQDWQDAAGSPQSFNTIRPDSMFTLQQSGNDIVVAYTIMVPEPQSLALAGIGCAAAGWVLRRRRTVARSRP